MAALEAQLATARALNAESEKSISKLRLELDSSSKRSSEQVLLFYSALLTFDNYVLRIIHLSTI